VAPAIKYVKFWRAYWEYASPLASPSEATIRLDHKPGEKVQVDFSEWCKEISINGSVTRSSIRLKSSTLFCAHGAAHPSTPRLAIWAFAASLG
jgi:hypothetical protein